MNTHATTYSLMVVAVAVMGAGSAFALNPACPTCEGDPLAVAEAERQSAVPVSVWLGQETYAVGDTVVVSGSVANIAPGYPITVKVVDPAGKIVAVDQLTVDRDGNYSTLLASDMWSATGLYQVMVQYGVSRDNKAQFVLVESSGSAPVTISGCQMNEFQIEDACVKYEMNGGQFLGATVNQEYNSVSLGISADENGMIKVDFPTKVLEGVFLVLVDGEEYNDAMIDGQTVTVWFLAGAENVEVVGSRVIPEFGTIAVLVLAAAVISIVAVSARSRLGLVSSF